MSSVLPPAETGKFIAENAEHVKILDEGLNKLTEEILSSMKEKRLEIPDTGADIIHPSKEHPRAADWVFVADTLNFCFWSNTGADKWTVDGHSGYYAMEAALCRALKEGYNISDPEYYSKITEEQLRHILRSDNEVEVPLFKERLYSLHQVGNVLLTKYNGTFKMCIDEANKSAKKLLRVIVDNFEVFRDESTYKGKKVAIYKRAQILVADLWYFFDRSGLGEFTDIDCLTMFADYRVPQVLVYFKALSYSDELMDLLKKDTLLPSGSEKEVEIRGCSIHAVELLRHKLEKRIREENRDDEVPNSSLIDYFLWCYRRKYAEEMECIPFHKTYGIYY